MDMDMEVVVIELLQRHFSLLFFSSALSFLAVALLFKMFRCRPWWCSCSICHAYLTSSWSADFDNLCDWYSHLLRQSPTATVHVHVLGNVLTANPANVEHMLRARFDNYPKGKPFSAILGDLLGHGIFNVDGECWRFQRKMAAAELGSSAVRYFAFCVAASEVRSRLLPLLDVACENDEVLDLQDVFRRLAFDNICKISFGLDPGCLELSLPMTKFAAAFDMAARLSACRAMSPAPLVWKVKRLLNLGQEKELRRSLREIDFLAQEVIRQKRKLGFSSDHDLLSRFMGCVGDDEGDDYLRDIVISFMLAGRDTVASALTCFFLLLAQHPRVSSAIRDEIERIASAAAECDVEVLLSHDELRGMHYVHAAIYESMRLYPPVQFDSKFCNDDDELPDGTFVGKGTRVTYHAYAMGRMEDLWGSDCLEFRPERWLSSAGVFMPGSPFKYPVFHAGFRSCIGKEVALMEMKAVIVSVVRRFDVHVLEGSRSPKFAPGLTASLSGGLPVRVRRRKAAPAANQ